MAIQTLSYTNALLVPDPKYIVLNGPNATVYTGADIPVFSNHKPLPVLEVYPEMWGAIANNSSASAAGNTSAITSAIATGLKVKLGVGTYYITPITINNSTNATHIEGSGYRKTILKSITHGASAHMISIVDDGTDPYTGVNPNDIYQHLTITDLALIGDGSTGSAIYVSGVAWYTFEDLYIRYAGGHGIHLTETTPPSVSHGSYIGTINRCKIAFCGGDGIYQVSASPSSQQNASVITNNELQQNANGLTIWGYKIAVVHNTIENNIGYGVRVQNFITNGTGDSAKSITIRDNYFESNTSGHIYAKTDAVNSGVIFGIDIASNFGFSYNSVSGANFKDVIFEASGINEAEVRTLYYANNTWTHLIENTVEADFGGALGFDSNICPSYNIFGANPYTGLDTLTAKYINLGMAKLHTIESIVCQGLWDGKLGSNISYSGISKSDNIVLSGANITFPVKIPYGSVLLPISVYCETNSTNYSVTFDLFDKAYNSASAHASRANIVIANNTGSKVVATNGFNTYSSGTIPMRQNMGNIDMVLKITITLTTPGTFFYLHNPVILYS